MNAHVTHIDAFRTISDTERRNGLVIRWAGHYFDTRASVLDRVHDKYYLIYVYQGKGYIRNAQNEVERVEAGSIVLFQPGQRQNLWADADDPFAYYGTCFCGHVIDSLLAGSPLLEKTHHAAPLDRKMLSMMNSFLNLMLLDRESYDELLIVSNFFSILVKANGIIELSGQHARRPKSSETALDQVEQYMRIHYHAQLCVDDLKRVCKYSATWLETNFREKYGATPLQYLARIRIRKAQELFCSIEGEHMNISEVAYAVGFNDPLYFSKVFKRITGLSPKDYRTLHQHDGGNGPSSPGAQDKEEETE